MAIQQVMSPRSGHDTHAFDKADKVSLAEAEERFDSLVRKGYLAAEAKDGGHTQLRKFDPDAEVTVFVPPLVGG